MTPEQRASHARELLANPVFDEVTKAVIEAAFATLIRADAKDHDLRQAKAAELRAIDDLIGTIRAIATPVTRAAVKSVA